MRAKDWVKKHYNHLHIVLQNHCLRDKTCEAMELYKDQEVAKALIMLHKGEIKVKQHPTNSGEIEFIFPTKEN